MPDQRIRALTKSVWDRPLRSPWRWVAATLMLVTAAVHVPLVSQHLHEAPYVGVLFIVLVVIDVVLALVILARDTLPIWVAGGTVALLALVAFLVSRTIGLPQIGDDIGNWTDPLGYPSLASEFLTLLNAAAILYVSSHSMIHPTRSQHS